MAVFIKYSFYSINILTIVYVAIAFVFSIIFLTKTHDDLKKVNINIESKYKEFMEKYKEISVFILKNHLPENIEYFNSIGDVVYDLPPIQEIMSSELQHSIAANKNSNSDINAVVECYNGKCINVHVNTKKILKKILQDTLWKEDEFIEIPIKESMLLKRTICLFIAKNKNMLVITLSYLFMLYSFQALLLFVKSHRLTKAYVHLLAMSDSTKHELANISQNYDKLYAGILFIQGLLGEYFSHHIHQLITREIYSDNVDIKTLFLQIQEALSWQIVKRKLRIICEYKSNSIALISDNELVFITLLNFAFRAINRSKIASEVVIKISQEQNFINIEIKDTGYTYNSKIKNNIQIYELPNPILESICKKIKMEVKEVKLDEVNIISIKIGELLKAEKVNSTSKINNNIVQFIPNGKKNS